MAPRSRVRALSAQNGGDIGENGTADAPGGADDRSYFCGVVAKQEDIGVPKVKLQG
jgi:hypothetical protein